MVAISQTTNSNTFPEGNLFCFEPFQISLKFVDNVSLLVDSSPPGALRNKFQSNCI